jgi:sulfur carrier protein
MRIRLNGEDREIEDGLTLARLLETLGVNPRAVAVAVNAAVIPRAGLAARALAERDEVEVIEAVGGG